MIRKESVAEADEEQFTMLGSEPTMTFSDNKAATTDMMACYDSYLAGMKSEIINIQKA